MSARPTARSPLRRLLLTAFVVAYLGYFGLHALNGSFGVRARMDFDAETDLLEGELAELWLEKDSLESRAALIRPAGLDPDMIDELARRSLNVIAPNEVVIIP